MNLKNYSTILLTVSSLFLSSADVLADSDTTMRVDPGDPSSAAVTRAVAVLQPTQGNQAHGSISFTQTGQGLRVQAQLQGLKPGTHAYHVHLYGDCSAPDGKSAGTHFNFQGSSENPPEDIQRITGNLGELEADADGKASADSIVEMASLQGDHSIIGRAVIVHERGNDPDSPPMGDTGARIACGVIGVGEASS
jgi:Cu-Zn family superoxide dismutase